MTSTSGEKPERKTPGAFWLTSGLGIAQICSWGSLYYSFPLLAEAMRDDLGWSKPQIYGAATVGLVLAGLAAYPVGSAIDRGHGRYVMGLASVTAGVLLALWSQISNLAAFYCIFAAIGCLQAATLYEASFAVITRRLGSENARRGITTLTLWGGFASTVFIPLSQYLIASQGWRGTLLFLAAINIVICGGLQFALINPSRDRTYPTPEAGTILPLMGRKAVMKALHLPAFWALLVAFIGYAAAFSALTFHLYPMLLERGLDSTTVVAVMAMIGPAQVAGRIAIWILAPNAPIRLLGCSVVLVMPVAVAGFAYAPPELFTLTIVAVMYGAANGIMTIVRGLAVPEMLSRNAYGAINGALIAPTLLVQALAPLAAASIWAASTNYSLVYVVILASTLVLVISFWLAALLVRIPADSQRH